MAIPGIKNLKLNNMMGNLKSMYLLLFIAFFTLSCKKTSDANSQPVVSNLDIQTNISSNGSGNVDFTATATNATNYTFEFGDGVIKSNTTGVISYKYTAAGSNSYTVTVTASGTSGSVAKKSITITVIGSNGTSLLWSEEFNVDGSPDPNKWSYDLGAGGWGNAELEYYTSRAQNVTVSNGTLKINLLKESYNNSPYTSARIVTRDKFAFTYGRVEVRAKLPSGLGTWPAIWMLGSNFATSAWPSCGEIDIMEQHGSEPNKVFGTLHYPGHSGGNGNGNTTAIANASTQFHVYKLDWSASYINLYVDDVLFHSVPNSGSIPFNHDFFLILNLAMGGTFGGSVDPNFASSTMEIDYIRVYQ